MQQQFLTPLCVDMDGTLIETNTIFEAFLLACKKNPLRIFELLFTYRKGKAHVKQKLGEYIQTEKPIWLYNRTLLAFLRNEHTKGRTLILATASDFAIAQRVANELGIFDEVIANTIANPVSASKKYKLLTERFGNKGYSYAGNSTSDIAVWDRAASAVIVHAKKNVADHVRKRIPVEAEFPRERRMHIQDIMQEMRMHQWLKNLLVFVPPIMAHQIGNNEITFQATIGFFSFSLLASCMYVMNDLLDIPSDRAHQTKHLRPIASGTISAFAAIKLAALLLSGSFALALLFLPISFFNILLLYIGINAIYSFRAKKIPYIDISILAGLYVLRIIAGSAATTVPTSSWLFFFAGCFFFYLASMKRVIELLQLKARDDIAPGRGYRKHDTELLTALGMTFSLLSCIVLGLYIESESVTLLYARPDILWALIPLLGVWIIRMWYLTLTKKLPEDPVLFTSKDIVSYGIGATVGIVLLLATI